MALDQNRLKKSSLIINKLSGLYKVPGRIMIAIMLYDAEISFERSMGIN